MLILAAILAIFVYGMVAPMLGTIMPTFQLSADQNGNIALTQALGLVVASLSVGPLIDNRGKKVALLAGLSLIVLALFVLPSAQGYAALMGVMFLLGLGGGIVVTGANALAGDVDETRRGTVLNFLNLFFGLGGLATPWVANHLLGGAAVALCYTVGGLAAVTLVVHVVTSMPKPTGERGFKLSEAGTLLSQPVLYLLALFLFLYVACEVGVWNWLVTYLMSRGIAKEKALDILSLGFALGILVGRVVVSRILIKVPAPTVTLVASVLMAVTTWWMLQTNDPTMAAVAVFCAGITMAPVFPTTLAMVGDAFPRGTATAMGLVITFGWVGLAVSSPIIGAVAGKDSANLGTALLLLPGFSLAMIAVNLAVRPMLRKKA